MLTSYKNYNFYIYKNQILIYNINTNLIYLYIDNNLTIKNYTDIIRTQLYSLLNQNILQINSDNEYINIKLNRILKKLTNYHYVFDIYNKNISLVDKYNLIEKHYKINYIKNKKIDIYYIYYFYYNKYNEYKKKHKGINNIYEYVFTKLDNLFNIKNPINKFNIKQLKTNRNIYFIYHYSIKKYFNNLLKPNKKPEYINNIDHILNINSEYNYNLYEFILYNFIFSFLYYVKIKIVNNNQVNMLDYLLNKFNLLNILNIKLSKIHVAFYSNFDYNFYIQSNNYYIENDYIYFLIKPTIFDLITHYKLFNCNNKSIINLNNKILQYKYWSTNRILWIKIIIHYNL